MKKTANDSIFAAIEEATLEINNLSIKLEKIKALSKSLINNSQSQQNTKEINKDSTLKINSNGLIEDFKLTNKYKSSIEKIKSDFILKEKGKIVSDKKWINETRAKIENFLIKEEKRRILENKEYVKLISSKALEQATSEWIKNNEIVVNNTLAQKTSIFRNLRISNREKIIKSEVELINNMLKPEIEKYNQRKNKIVGEILSDAINNLRGNKIVIEKTSAKIEYKGQNWSKVVSQLIGKSGSRILGLKKKLGVSIVTPDKNETKTKNYLVISSFDPYNKELAARTLKEIINSRNFNISLLEKVLERKKKDLDIELNEKANLFLEQTGLDYQWVKNQYGIKFLQNLSAFISKFFLKESYGQSLIDHIAEVTKICKFIADKLNINKNKAILSALVHDVGKINTSYFGFESKHIEAGVDFAIKNSFPEFLIDVIQNHHSPLSDNLSKYVKLVKIGDIISGSRPGARGKQMEYYVQNIQKLNNIVKQKSEEKIKKEWNLSENQEVFEQFFYDSSGRKLLVWINTKNIVNPTASITEIGNIIRDKIEENISYNLDFELLIMYELNHNLRIKTKFINN